MLLLLTLPMPDTFIVTGTVVDHLQNRPLNYILVTLTSTQDRRLTVSAITGTDGRFGFNNVPAGKYSLSAQRRGNSPPQLYRQDDQYSTAIAVGPGLASQNIVFPLEAPGSISGTVLDQNGEPVRDAQVWLFHKVVSGGKPAIRMLAPHRADASGAFHAGNLSPGTYLAAVSAHPWYARSIPPQLSQSNPEFDVAYPITYYGDTTDPAAAAPVNLAEGGSASIQINLRAVPAVHVDLGASPLEGRRYPPNLAAETLGGHSIPLSAIGMGVNGHQGLAGVAPGHYILRTMSVDGRRGRLGPAARVDLTGDTTIALDNLKTTSITGQVSYEGADRPANPVALRFSCGTNMAGAAVEKDGSFNVRGQMPEGGRCEVDFINAPKFYVKSVAAAGGKPSADTVDIVEGADNRVTVLVAKGSPSELQGMAVRDDKPFPAAMVLLVPEDLTRPLRIRRDQSDSDGTFTLSNILPGRYTLLAIDDGKGLAYRDPAVIQPYLAQGMPLEFPRVNNSAFKINVIARRAN